MIEELENKMKEESIGFECANLGDQNHDGTMDEAMHEEFNGAEDY
ncbi:hypothetical protein ACJIZ3_006405 [Penstemon smallii]|uniref:Uncharacterized protein n=1 Tax=Penstemon smallii TaxID=265156 RepID=A0ABD3S7K4_9LAMI